MAKTPILKPEEIEFDTLWRGEIVKWDIYQRELDKENSRWFIKIAVKNPTETIQFETMYVRGVWWELIRFSGAGRRKGWIVAGDNQPVSVRALALYLNTDIEPLLPAIRRLTETRRLNCYSTSVDSDVSISKYPEISSDITQSPDLSHKKEKEKEKRREYNTQKLTPQQVLKLYNASCPNLPRALKLTTKRRQTIKARITEYPDIEQWKKAFAIINESNWHIENKKGLEYFLWKDKIQRILEGQIGARESQSQQSEEQRTQPTMEELLEARKARNRDAQATDTTS